MAHPFPRIEAAAIDGRLHTVYHRQVQLERLCKALVDNVNEIKQAIEQDYDYSFQEIATEYHQTLTALKQYYALLDPKEAHEEEYLVANGKDAPQTRAHAGVVYIEPTTHTFFYSSIVPLAAALAAGNCVIVLLENNIRSLSGLLRRILSSSLDADIFATASSPVKYEQFLRKSICVLQNGIDELPKLNQITSFAGAPVIAVVDRTADIQLAARELVAAGSSFGGGSPYRPDVILINEFKRQDFIQAVVNESLRLQSERSASKASTQEKSKPTLPIPKNCEIINQQPNLTIVHQPNRASILRVRTSARVLAIHSISSLDDAIDLIASETSFPCLAAYHFGNAATGKYLAQFIAAQHTFINHVPRDLLIGPPIPLSTIAGDPRQKYPTTIFSVPRPVYINETKTGTPKAARELIAEATTPLKEFKRHPGGGVGFFEQGFLINAGIIVVSTLTFTGTGLFWLWKWSRSV